MNYFELYPGDYLKDTGRLTLVDHGAYLRLLLEYYATEEPLPADLGDLYVIAAAVTAADKTAVKKVADRFFPVDPEDGLRHNGRVDEEIEKARGRMAAARENGKRGGRPKKNPLGSEEKPSGFSLGSIPVIENETQKKALQTPDPIQENVAIATLSPGKPDDDGIPPCPHGEILALYHELMPANPRMKVWDGARAAALRTRWREDRKRQSLDYWRRFFAHCAASPFLTGKREGQNGRPFLPGLDWLVTAGNFAKVIEGRYNDRSAA
ncbi:YdaU family protein [Pseudoxanthomonas koreensis]|uniref:YdaU family protein n=1 Tax=Pseudoxanthomonas koreensis TaxID=266061 RepID=UPI0013911BB5|nr:DUF1376 domain-containing protein [Pseudoxanthomonas koreensis]KAF1692677.1 hypothetical protein CSC64_06730 [Pseudoxanthomonas koreensis]